MGKTAAITQEKIANLEDIKSENLYQSQIAK